MLSDWSFVFTCTFKQHPSKLKKCLEIFLECGQRKAKNVVRKNKGKYPNVMVIVKYQNDQYHGDCQNIR